MRPQKQAFFPRPADGIGGCRVERQANAGGGGVAEISKDPSAPRPGVLGLRRERPRARAPAAGRGGRDGLRRPLPFDERHQGGPGLVHGGLVGAALDEACGLLATWHRFPTVTARIAVRFRRPVPINTELTVSSPDPVFPRPPHRRAGGADRGRGRARGRGRIVSPRPARALPPDSGGSRRGGRMATAVGRRLERVGRESASAELGLKGGPWTADTPRMESSPSYRPATVESFATALESRARNAALAATVFGLVVGGAVGAVPLMPVETVWNLPAGVGFGTALAGALVGGLIGRVLGNRRAAVHLLHAQTVLCQLHAQRATLAIWKLLRAREETSTRDEGLELAALSTSPLPQPHPEPEPRHEPDLVSSVDPIPEPSSPPAGPHARAQPEPPSTSRRRPRCPCRSSR